ncbi:unnamed protein product [Wuchereria bancrofti]|uniref:Uncharacterized protein n=1 Tax=Wuchereria bancrofti TaxID=6293 RepID=A0A3P7DYF6_WUCBA|nr:unnamed protein product [Wuchereria bancrofti]
MFSTIPMTPIIWLNLLLCIASDKNETFSLLNLDTGDEIVTNITHPGISDSFDILDYDNNFEPLFSSEFPSDPSQLIDFTQLSEIEDIGSKESKSETNLITNAPHLGFSNSYDLFGHTNLELSLGSHMDSYWNAWRDANGELRTNDDNLGYPSTRDAQGGTSSSLNPNTADEIVTNITHPGISDSFDILDYDNNFEPLFSSEFPSDPSQFIDFTQLSEIEDIGSEESKSETDLITNDPHLSFSNSYDLFGHTNLELSLGSDMDSYWNAWRDASGELRTNDDNVGYSSIRGENSSPLSLDTNGIYSHQLTLPSDDTSGQHANAEQNNIDNKYFSDNLNIPDYRENTNEGSFSNNLNILDYRGNTDGESKTGNDELHNDFSFYLL